MHKTDIEELTEDERKNIQGINFVVNTVEKVKSYFVSYNNYINNMKKYIVQLPEMHKNTQLMKLLMTMTQMIMYINRGIYSNMKCIGKTFYNTDFFKKYFKKYVDEYTEYIAFIKNNNIIGLNGNYETNNYNNSIAPELLQSQIFLPQSNTQLDNIMFLPEIANMANMPNMPNMANMPKLQNNINEMEKMIKMLEEIGDLNNLNNLNNINNFSNLNNINNLNNNPNNIYGKKLGARQIKRKKMQ